VVELRFGVDQSESYASKLDGIGERVEVLPDRILLYVADGDAALSAVHERALAPSEHQLALRGMCRASCNITSLRR
jgi:lipooligosaccharide transport system ATP-binding protein